MVLTIELDREEDARFIAEVLELPGVLCYGVTADAAIRAVKALALRVLGERVEHGEAAPPDDVRLRLGQRCSNGSRNAPA